MSVSQLCHEMSVNLILLGPAQEIIKMKIKVNCVNCNNVIVVDPKRDYLSCLGCRNVNAKYESARRAGASHEQALNLAADGN